MLILALLLQSIPGAAPLEPAGDPALEMLEGIKRHLVRLTATRDAGRPDREALRRAIGAVDARVAQARPELLHPALAEAARFRVFAARWPVLDGLSAEGLYFEPRQRAVCRSVVLPDFATPPEQETAAQFEAARGCEVFAPVLIDRAGNYSGRPGSKAEGLPHREFVYRAAFPLGRHPLGYEVQKVLAAVDILAARRPALPVRVLARGESARLALYAAALDPRVAAIQIEEPLRDRAELWREPIDFNVFGLLRGLNDAQVGELIRPREINVAALPRPGRPLAIPAGGAPDRLRRQLREMLAHTWKLVERSEAVRAERFAREGARLKDALWNDVFGRLPADGTPPAVRARQSYRGESWTGYDISLAVRREFNAYGVLLVPDGIKPGERRAAVVCQHGLNGRPQDLFLQPDGKRERDVYRNFGETLARAGYVVYLPQNPYIHDFRPIARLANPLGLSLYSVILAQYERTLDWLAALPYVDPARIGFYGLSYGGKTALRVPPLTGRFAAVVCGGDFNEWIRKLTSTQAAYSYMFTAEYEIVEWDLAHTASHAEMAMLLAPVPFLVERGHRDGVGVDEWVSYEYAKVRRYYDEQGWGDRTGIAFFNGPHRVDGVEALRFLKRFLGSR